MAAGDAGSGDGSYLIEDPAELRFLLTGTARSGTTLVQRLACELPEVWVPQETHFWSAAAELAERWEWPVRGDDRHAVAEAAVSIPPAGPLPAEPRQVARQMMSRQRRIGLWTVFESLVAELSPPDRAVVGEKTPNHMFWWEQAKAAVPGLKLVAVVRHPADVLRSHRGVPWGEHDPHALAERWIAHQRAALDALRVYGPQEVLVLRYEDVVADPDSARAAMAALLGVAPGPSRLSRSLVRRYPLYAPHETWKRRALGKVGGGRAGSRPDLPAEDRAVVEGACAGLMAEFGYEAGEPSGRPAAPQGEALDKILAFRRWHASIGSSDLPIY